MSDAELFQGAREDHVKAQDLAIKVKENASIFTNSEILICRDIFEKWFLYFDNQAKTTTNKAEKANFRYLKNRFLDYYRSLL